VSCGIWVERLHLCGTSRAELYAKQSMIWASRRNTRVIAKPSSLLNVVKVPLQHLLCQKVGLLTHNIQPLEIVGGEILPTPRLPETKVNKIVLAPQTGDGPETARNVTYEPRGQVHSTRYPATKT
jgi:hypothetical protein